MNTLRIEAKRKVNGLYHFSEKISRERVKRLPKKTHDKIVECLVSLKEEPRPSDVKKLHGREGYRIRAGDYRVLYIVDDADKKVEVFSIAHRREVYQI